MGFLDRHMGKILLALILISGSAVLLFGHDLYRTLGVDTSPPPPAIEAQTQSEALQLPTLKPKGHYELIANRNLFVFPEGAMAKNSPSPPPEDQPKMKTTLHVRLKGTIISSHGFALAMIEDRAKRKEDIYIVGDQVQDARILEIQREQVILNRAGEEEILTLFSEDKGRGTRGASSSKPSLPKHKPAARRARVESSPKPASSRQIQQKIRLLMAQLRLRPHFEQGKPAGFKVGNVADGSVFQAGGLKQGDVVISINDEDVRTPNQLLKAYRGVVEDEELWLTVSRDGEEEDIDVDIEGILPEE